MREFKSNVQQKLEAKNAKPVKFDFLTPVSEYVTKVYGEIEGDLERSDYAEIAREIQKNNDLVIKTKDNSLLTITQNRSLSAYSQYSQYDNDKDTEKKRQEEPIKLSVNYIPYGYLEEGKTPNWTNTAVAELSDVYYINDYTKFSNYILDNIKKEAEKTIKVTKEIEVKNTEKVSTLFKELKAYNLKTLDFSAIEAERTILELNDSKTPAKRKLEIMGELAHDEDYY